MPPFQQFDLKRPPPSKVRAAVTAAYRRPEPDCIAALIEEARLPESQVSAIHTLGKELAEAQRAGRPNAVSALMHAFPLASEEGLALMCLSEALLRIPDPATREALIRDKLTQGNWLSHWGHTRAWQVKAAILGLAAGRKVSNTFELNLPPAGLSACLKRLIEKGSAPLIRKSAEYAMQQIGKQFVLGETIQEALTQSRLLEAQGFRYSYDMLGEAAVSAEDAQRYFDSYRQAIEAMGQADPSRNREDKADISIKLSALHPRYTRAQIARVHTELLPRLQALCQRARHYDIGVTIDAEEADRLELSLELLEALCFEPALAGWEGMGFVVQAYQKRAPFLIDYLMDLAHRSHRRLRVRLVKGAYWDSEIKRAQVDGLKDYPVYTRKVHTDISYLACAKKLLTAPEAICPQFATHNAHTLAAVYYLAGAHRAASPYEFQRLHGMGEPLYEAVRTRLNRPCRIYAPVGAHDTLLPYLVRRLLENGANTSFINQIAAPTIDLDALLADPVREAEKISLLGAPHSSILLPRELYGKPCEGARANAQGLDVSDEQCLSQLSQTLLASAERLWQAAPLLAQDAHNQRTLQAVRNPADRREFVGHVTQADTADVEAALAHAAAAATGWGKTDVRVRISCLIRAADLFEARMAPLIGLLVREAGKSLPNAIAEVRESVDFLRYYAHQIQEEVSQKACPSLGVVVCISPWNFPLAIFTGQVSAALAAGHVVLAKPAEQTPLIAAESVRLLYEAGVPRGALQLLPGAGDIGAALVKDSRTQAVLFTGSIEVAQEIHRTLSERLNAEDQPVVLIAETGGQNAMVVDSSALSEQVIVDVLTSAFDSAGQRCSALRVLCLQEEIAEHTLALLKGAMQELSLGPPDRLDTDIGPVIDAEAKARIQGHIEAMRGRGLPIFAPKLPEACGHGTFIPPTLIEIDGIQVLEHEVFGPVLHVLRYKRSELDALIDAIRATGYSLTFGLHTRLDQTIQHLSQHAPAGNLYVNRNMVGAVVGVQPFGGERLSGTGPKAGGPFYVPRLRARPDRLPSGMKRDETALAALAIYRDWLANRGVLDGARCCEQYLACSPLGGSALLPGPTGECNRYWLVPRGMILCVAQSALGAQVQFAASLATGNTACYVAQAAAQALQAALPEVLKPKLRVLAENMDAACEPDIASVLFEGEPDAMRAFNARIARRTGPILSVQGLSAQALGAGRRYRLAPLLIERSVSINTTAAGGNASLMSLR